MRNHIKTAKTQIMVNIDKLKTLINTTFLRGQKWKKHNKIAILSALLISVIIWQFVHMQELRNEILNNQLVYEDVVEQIQTAHDTNVKQIEAERQEEISNLQDENFSLVNLNKNYENEIEELKSKVKTIDEKLETKKQTIADLKKATSRKGGGSNGEWMTFTATAYTKNCYKCSGITRSGINLHNLDYTPKIIAADKTVLPLGTKVEIKGMGIYTVEDTGGKILNRRIDILFPTKAEAFQFGRNNIQLRVIENS